MAIETYFENIAAAIRQRAGTTGSLTPAQMPQAILDIPGGSTPTLITKSITQNGTYNASADNADGYSSVTVNVAGGPIKVADWDFAISDTDSVSGYSITKSYATAVAGTGYQFTNQGAYIRFPANMVGCSKTYVIDMGEMTLNQDGNNKRFFMSSGQNGFIYRKTGVWSFYDGSWGTDSTLTDFDYFANSKVGIYIDANAYWHVYKDGTLVYNSDRVSTVLSANSSPLLMLGSLSGDAARTITIKGFEVYLGNLYA